MRQIRIDDRLIEAESVDRLTLKHWIRIEQETGALGRPMTWSQVREAVDRVTGLKPDKAEKDPDFWLVVGVILWASRYAAGETDLSLMDAVDVPMSSIEFLADEEDLVTPGGGVGGPRRARPASGRAGSAKGGSSKGKKKARSATSSSDA